jgi:hypothetical protein
MMIYHHGNPSSLLWVVIIIIPHCLFLTFLKKKSDSFAYIVFPIDSDCGGGTSSPEQSARCLHMEESILEPTVWAFRGAESDSVLLS